MSKKDAGALQGNGEPEIRPGMAHQRLPIVIDRQTPRLRPKIGLDEIEKSISATPLPKWFAVAAARRVLISLCGVLMPSSQRSPVSADYSISLARPGDDPAEPKPFGPRV
ncbi:MAG: hypothetical protein R3E51_07290 [Rhizobiaceae bacterium]